MLHIKQPEGYWSESSYSRSHKKLETECTFLADLQAKIPFDVLTELNWLLQNYIGSQIYQALQNVTFHSDQKQNVFHGIYNFILK